MRPRKEKDPQMSNKKQKKKGGLGCGGGAWKDRNIECESILGAGMEVGAVGYRCLRHQWTCQNSATHLRVGLAS